MKLIIAFAAVACLSFEAAAQPSPQPSVRPVPPGLARPGMMPGRPGAPATPPPMPDTAKLSYAIGMSIANNIKHDELDLDIDTLATAMKDVLGNKPTRLSEAELKETMMQFQQAMPAWVAKQNKVKGEAFLAKYAKQEGVKTLTNGLEYKVIKDGSGPMPKADDTVVVNYKGTLVDGTVFDSRSGFTNRVTGQTIKGWSEILPLMKTGSKWEVAIPSDLAYGARGPRSIGPDSTLIFEMELVSIAPPAPPAPAFIANKPFAAGLPQHNPPPLPPMATSGTTPVVSGQIIKVPSAEELKKGAKIEVITNAPAQ